MLRKTITYKGVDGKQEFTEDFYFHLSKAELVELEASRPGGLSEWVKRIVASEDVTEIVPEFKKLLLLTYGKRSDDGRRFIKTQQLRDEFAATEAFSELFIELCSDADKAAAFVNGIMPAGLEEQVAQMEREPNRAERRHPSDFAAKPAPANPELHPGSIGSPPINPDVEVSPPGEGRNVFEKTNPDGPVVLTRAQVIEMDSDDLKSGLQTGRYVIASDHDL